MATEKDAVLGEIKGRIPLFKDAIDAAGNIILFENGLIIDADGQNFKTAYSFVKSIEKTGDMAMGKVGVGMVVYDHIGQKFTFDVCMADQHFAALKSACGK